MRKDNYNWMKRDSALSLAVKASKEKRFQYFPWSASGQSMIRGCWSTWKSTTRHSREFLHTQKPVSAPIVTTVAVALSRTESFPRAAFLYSTASSARLCAWVSQKKTSCRRWNLQRERIRTVSDISKLLRLSIPLLGTVWTATDTELLIIQRL